MRRDLSELTVVPGVHSCFRKSTVVSGIFLRDEESSFWESVIVSGTTLASRSAFFVLSAGDGPCMTCRAVSLRKELMGLGKKP